MRNLYTIKHCAYAQYISLWHNIDFLAAHKPFASPYCGLINANFARCQLFSLKIFVASIWTTIALPPAEAHTYTLTHTLEPLESCWTSPWVGRQVQHAWQLGQHRHKREFEVWSVFGLRCKDHSIGCFFFFTWKLFVSTFFFRFLRIQPTANFTINKRRTKPASAACSSANKLLVPRNSLAPPLPHTSL